MAFRRTCSGPVHDSARKLKTCTLTRNDRSGCGIASSLQESTISRRRAMKEMSLKRVTAVAALVTTRLLSASAAANTAAADEQRAAAQFRCGFYESGGSAYYGHCDAPPRTDIVIHVTGEFPNLT
jgi:hypothetical protein